MLVTDLHHFLDLSADVPGPARKLAEQLSNIVQAASAGDVNIVWETALPCRRRPANRRCPGRIVVVRAEPNAPISWRCSRCGDDGTISNWAGAPYDLCRRQLTVAEPLHDIVIDVEVAATLRSMLFLDNDCQRAVFAIRSRHDSLHLAVTAADLDELIGAVAAEANHETNRRHRQRLDAAFDALTAAAHR